MAYVTFAKPEDALSAYEALDKKSFQGRLLHILPAVNRKGKVEVEEVGKKRTVKGDRDTQRKAMAGKEFNWSMLYMNVRRQSIYLVPVLIPVHRATPSSHRSQIV